MTKTFNKILESERMPEEWRSVLVPIFKNKGDVQSRGNYRGIKSMPHNEVMGKSSGSSRSNRRTKDRSEHL